MTAQNRPGTQPGALLRLTLPTGARTARRRSDTT
ncbi:hypothetical protein FHX39_002462 [Friedmanniella antarctica]|uniref:Uncharacterized protein n=1 Tax=Microlunatus antarcticus TaxID=53388 RepID=A0A7W5P7I1_9ACTN|nr:hypothetical protein [Microlunatus antarcticus]